jgi:hypothetical protein
MRAKSIKGNSFQEIKTALEASLEDGFQPTLAIVFLSVTQDRAAIAALLKGSGMDLIGASSAGEFVDGHQSEGGIAILLLDIKRDNYRIQFHEVNEGAIAAVAKAAVEQAKTSFVNPAFILCSSSISASGVMFPGDLLVHEIVRAAGEKTPIFGGMSGADGSLNATYVFTADQSTDIGFVLLVLDQDKVDIHGMAISGWKPVGKIRTITHAEDGWIYSIDDQPALDMYLRYLGQSLQTVEDVHKEIGFFYPFLSIDAGEPSLRTPLVVDPEKKAIKLDFTVAQGKQIQFTLPPDFEIVETVLEQANNLKKSENAEVNALLIFSCYGRLSVLGPMIQEENEGLVKIWKSPMAGFFSYGEFGKDSNSDHVFHSTTCSWVGLKEK